MGKRDLIFFWGSGGRRNRMTRKTGIIGLVLEKVHGEGRGGEKK